MNKEILTKALLSVNKKNCKGIFFRGYHNIFQYKGKIELREGIRFLKRKSCSGCFQCKWIMDNINEDIACGCLIWPNEIKDGKLYSIHAINPTYDIESDICDGYDLEIFEIKEET